MPPKRPRGGGFGLHERLEELRLSLRRDADAGVGDRQRHALARGRVGGVREVLRRHAHAHLAVRREFDRIAEQIEENLTQAPAVAA